MSDGEVSSGISSEPVIASLPTPISVEPRTVPAGEAVELARQAEEAKLSKGADPKKDAPAAKDESKKPLSTRDALRAAAAKVNAEPAVEKASPLKTDPKTAEPVAKAAEPAKEPAKNEPAKAAEPAKTEPVRGDDGKFVSAKAAVEPAKTAPDPAKDAPVAKIAEPVKPSFTAEPPPARASAAAKEKWAETPEEVRNEFHRAVKELTAGHEKYRAAAERDAELGEYHEMATKGGTTVKEALSKYVNMENVLRADAVKGLELIAQNVGMSLKDVAAKILGQAPDVAASQQDATIRELNAKIARLEQGLGSIEQERTQQKTDSTTEAVTKFAADPAHSRFEELSEDIAFFLKTRTKDLAEAYKLAERLNPAPAKAAEPEPITERPASSAAPVVTLVPSVTPVAASTAGQKSIAGAPTAGSDPVRKQPSSSIKEALRRAQQRAG